MSQSPLGEPALSGSGDTIMNTRMTRIGRLLCGF